MRAKVKWFNKEKGFGFLEYKSPKNSEDDKDIFVHYSAIQSEGYKELYQGQVVDFELVKTDKGYQAKEVEAIKINS